MTDMSLHLWTTHTTIYPSYNATDNYRKKLIVNPLLKLYDYECVETIELICIN